MGRTIGAVGAGSVQLTKLTNNSNDEFVLELIPTKNFPIEENVALAYVND
jgi:hypothetical protein